MSRRPLPGGLPSPGNLVLRHADAEMLHDEDETRDLLAQTACPDKGLRHQHRRAVGLTLQRQPNLLRLASPLRLEQAALRHERFVLHDALGELLRYPSEDPWEQAVTVYRGLWLAVGYHLVRVQIETAEAGISNSSRAARLREVLAGQSRCSIARPEEIDGYGHACLDLPISDDLRVRWRTGL